MRRVFGAERGAGSVLMVGVLGAVALLAGLVLPVAAALVARHSVVAAADAVALAAADVAVGRAPGYPCLAAADVALANGVSLDDCALDGLVATVAVSSNLLGIALSASATAGPPRVEVD